MKVMISVPWRKVADIKPLKSHGLPNTRCVGIPIAPAKWPRLVSTVITASRFSHKPAVHAKSPIFCQDNVDCVLKSYLFLALKYHVAEKSTLPCLVICQLYR